MRETTRNEAFHRQLKAFYRNVMVQSARNATVVAAIATLSQLIAGGMARAATSTKVSQSDLLRIAASVLDSQMPSFEPRLDVTVSRTHVSVAQQADLPPGVKRPRRNR